MDLIKEKNVIELMAKRFEDQGYAVTLQPGRADIPFDLGNYRPDLLAVRDDEKLIVEVKRTGSTKTPDTYRRVSAAVARYPGWSFRFVALPDELFAEDMRPRVSRADLEALLEKLDRSIDRPDMAGLVLPPLWTILMTVLARLLEPGVETAWSSDYSLLNIAYTQGFISFEEKEELQRFRKLRDEAVHSLRIDIPRDEVARLRRLIEDMLEQWDEVPAANDRTV